MKNAGNIPVLVLHRKSANRPEVKAAVKATRAAGHKLEVRIPWNKKAKRNIVRELLGAGHRRIIAGGGDGTLNAVANELIKQDVSDVEMGVLPLGTANDFARGLSLPVNDLNACLIRACKDSSRPIDVGTLNGRCFINVASGGFGAEVTATTPQEIKRQLGGAAYTLAGLVKIWKMQPYSGSLELPGKEPLSGNMLLMAVGNNRFAGGGFEVAPRAKLDDGLLDLMVLTEESLADPAATLAEIADIGNPANRLVHYWQVPSFVIHSERPLHINLDGEPVEETDLAFAVKPGVLRLVSA